MPREGEAQWEVSGTYLNKDGPTFRASAACNQTLTGQKTLADEIAITFYFINT